MGTPGRALLTIDGARPPRSMRARSAQILPQPIGIRLSSQSRSLSDHATVTHVPRVQPPERLRSVDRPVLGRLPSITCLRGDGEGRGDARAVASLAIGGADAS